MVDSVKVDAYYEKAKDVPHIGQRKWMLVNGTKQLMTLNHIEAKRRRYVAFDDETLRDESVTEFTTEEVWGQYY